MRSKEIVQIYGFRRVRVGDYAGDFLRVVRGLAEFRHVFFFHTLTSQVQPFSSSIYQPKYIIAGPLEPCQLFPVPQPRPPSRTSLNILAVASFVVLNYRSMAEHVRAFDGVEGTCPKDRVPARRYH